MRKFFNSIERHLANTKSRNAKRLAIRKGLLKEIHKPSQTPDAIRMRQWRKNGNKTIVSEELKQKVRELAVASKLTEALVAKATVSEDYTVIRKMYEPDEIEQLVKSLHIKFLMSESNE